MPLMGDWTQLRKESLSFRISQQKLPKLKTKEKKDWGKNKQASKQTKNRTERPGTVGQLQRV